ncbi:MAG: hypothetical protein M1549_00440 [Candidatus Dependentiae bacterium]|nr:hypothetical protein [Candidatus Dependentiae bacterium]
MEQKFSGSLHIFHAFDVGEDIDLERIREKQLLVRQPVPSSKYFKNYHKPLAVELPHPHQTSHCKVVRLHPFGVISLHYQIPFESSFERLARNIGDTDNNFREQSVADAAMIYKAIEPVTKKPTFFHIARSYLVIQIDTTPELNGQQLQEQYGVEIASLLRFEDKSLSEYKKNEILERAFGYFRGDLIVIDTEASFIYDDEYEELLDLFEFVNVQQLELQYFDRVLDEQLTQAYNVGSKKKLSLREYIPRGRANLSREDNLAMLKVEISVITERLENSIKLAGEPYYTELYEALSRALGLNDWKTSIGKKLSIVQDLSEIYEHRAQAARDDLINILIVILIFLELIVGIVQYLHL